jgi:phage tail sheath protein FI
VVNPGSSIGGANGNAFYNWEERPAFLNNDPMDVANYQVRNPVPQDPFFVGGANGIPPSAIFASALDAAIIGNPATSSGMWNFQNPEVFDVNLLLIPGNSSGAVIGNALQLCESRGDVLFIVDPPFGLRPQQVVDWHNGMLFSDLTAAINSSYGALYWPWIKIFNQFDSTELFVPPSGFVASVFSRTARVREQWFAPAGLQRGHLLTALDVEFNATQGERDLMYGLGNAVNPIVNFPQDGITVFGQRTLQRAQTALDRVNVRMLLIFLKKNLVRLLRFFLFEPIDRLLFAEVRASITPFLQDVMARRGLTAFKVICDATNNTPETIDRNELHVSVLLKPTKAAEFIVLNLVILRTDASFSAEEVLQAAGVVGATTQVI